jgi:hypothetical protein
MLLNPESIVLRLTAANRAMPSFLVSAVLIRI